MKKILYAFSIMLAALAMTSCSEETYEGANPALIPNADDINATITVDPETNQVTLLLNNQGCYPIWKLNKGGKTVQSTVNGYNDIITMAGEYTVEVQMGNKHGICQGSKTYTFTIENSIVDWTPYLTFLNGGEGGTKRWEMAYTQKGHMGCGEPGSDGLNWWSAGPNEKAGTGMYQSIMQFTDKGAPNGEYVLDPGTEGMIYANKDVTAAPYGDYNPYDDNDYSVPYEKRTSTYTLTIEGTDLFIEFPAGQCIPYLPSNYMLDNPRYRVLSLTRNKMELLSEEPGVINWHFTFVPEGSQAESGDEPVEDDVEWVDANSAANLLNGGELALASCWWANNDWGPITNPDVAIEGRTATITVAEANGGNQWQGQVHLNTGVAITEGKAYDFKIVLNPTQDLGGATVKPHPDGDDDHMFSAARHDLLGYEDNAVTYTNVVADFSTDNLVITLDFPGCSAGTVISVKEIIIQKHAGENWVDENSDLNLWKNCSKAWNNWTADNNWGSIANPDCEFGENSITCVYSEQPGGNQWQAQVKIDTDIVLDANKAYDFYMEIEPTCDIPGATIKLTSTSDDGTFFTADRHDLMGYEKNVFKFINQTGKQINDFQLCFDFAGVQAGATVKISHIIIQEHIDD